MEPQWWVGFLLHLNVWMMNHPALIYRIPKLADIFVFVYPIFLLVLYFRWKLPQIATSLRSSQWRGALYYKISALTIGFSVLMTAIINVLIQYFVDKVRPNAALWLIDNKTESILHDFLPSSSFPSDHAAVSMSVAMATLLRWIMKKDRRFVWISIPLFVFSLIMWFCRITAAIHRPTDIIAWSVVWLLVPLILTNRHVSWFFERIARRIWKKI